MVRGEDIYRPIIYLVREEQGIRVLPLRHFLLKRPTSKKQPGRAQMCDRPITLNSILTPTIGLPQKHISSERSGATERRPAYSGPNGQ